MTDKEKVCWCGHDEKNHVKEEYILRSMGNLEGFGAIYGSSHSEAYCRKCNTEKEIHTFKVNN